jgi:hypothetical protein
MSEQRLTRREIIKKAAYVAPIILTAKANFSFASAGSGDYAGSGNSIDYIDKDKKDKKEKKDNDDNTFKNYTNHNSR